MSKSIDKNSIRFIQNVDQAISVMSNAGKWLLDTGKNPSKWWQLQNLNREFLLQYAKPEEFYVALVDEKPAAAAIFQIDQNAQDWKSVDKSQPHKALYIHWLCVNRQFAGMGLPKIMVDCAAEKAQENNTSLLRADTTASVTKLRKIYEDVGFSLMAIEKEDYRETAFYQKRVGE